MKIVGAILLSMPLIGAYAIYAIGVVLIYRASRVLNLAHGVMASVPALLLSSFAGAGLPLFVSLPLAMVSGGALGYLVERIFVRPARSQSPTAQTVGTVVVLGLVVAVTGRIWGGSQLGVTVFPEGFIPIGSSNLRYGEIGLFFTMLAIFGALTVLFKYSELGLLMRGAAENPRAASLMGVDPDRMTSFTWILGGLLAGIAGILLAAVTSLDPYSLPLQALPGFLAALLGGLASLPGAVAGAALVGLVQSFIPLVPSLQQAQGSPQLILALVGMVVMAMRGRRLTGAGE